MISSGPVAGQAPKGAPVPAPSPGVAERVYAPPAARTFSAKRDALHRSRRVGSSHESRQRRSCPPSKPADSDREAAEQANGIGWSAVAHPHAFIRGACARVP